MSDDTDPRVLVELRWLAPTDRVRVIVGQASFACNARFPDRKPVDLFSIVLSGFAPDSPLADLRLLVPTDPYRLIADRLRPGEHLELTEGPHQLAEARVLTRNV